MGEALGADSLRGTASVGCRHPRVARLSRAVPLHGRSPRRSNTRIWSLAPPRSCSSPSG